MDSIVDVPLSDEEQRAIGLAAAFDWACAQRIQVQPTACFDPVHGAEVSDKDLVRVELGRR